MKRLIIEVDDGVNIEEAMDILKEIDVHEEFILSMKMEIVK
jgi:hypothetical protein